MAERHVRTLPRRRGQDPAHVLAMDVFHGDEVFPGRLTDIVNLHDVLMVQRRDDARLVEEHPYEPLIACELGPDPLEHDVALEALDAVASCEHHVGHAARGQVFQHHIATETYSHRYQH